MKRRATPTKQAVLDLLKAQGKAMSHDAIGQGIDIGINRATIYRVLNRFCEDGVLHRIVAEDGKQYFAVCSNCSDKKHQDNHFHFRCEKCETIECLKEPINFSIPQGYRVASVTGILTGICVNCSG